MARLNLAARLVRPLLLGVLGSVLIVLSDPAGGVAGQHEDDDGPPRVLVNTLDGAISPVTADYVMEGVGRAESGGYDAYVLSLDTPGGLESSMRDIAQRFLGASVPVIVHVSPEGARAASAGALITFAANVAAMAPGTTIGAATPVSLDGETEVGDKIVNDAAAFAAALAEVRDRDVDFAEDTVREGRSATASEALEVGAVDLIARTLDDVLAEVDGQEVEVAPGERVVVMRTAGAEVDEDDMGTFRRIQQALADPNLLFLFLSVGTLGLIYELASPGIGVGGVVGVIMVVLALFGLAVLPVDAVGLILLALAIALFVAELFAPGIGLAAGGGAIVLALSGVFLFRDTPGLQVSAAVVTPVAVVAGGSVVLAGRLVARTRGVPSTTTGLDRFVGREVTVVGADGAKGRTFTEGAWWEVRAPEDEEVVDGEARVAEVRGLHLVVTRAGAGSTDDEIDDEIDDEGKEQPT